MAQSHCLLTTQLLCIFERLVEIHPQKLRAFVGKYFVLIILVPSYVKTIIFAYPVAESHLNF